VSSYDVGRAISIAKAIPTGTGSYDAAQKAAQQWESSSTSGNGGL
jgi:hypothetical protein